MKHAEARNIKIMLGGRDGSVTLRVEDDGIGMPAEPIVTKGLGLKIMRYRASLINAHLAIDSKAPKGTAVTCALSREARDGEGQTARR